MRFRLCRAALPFLLLLATHPASAGRLARPAREVRAVWITTILGLDWPKSADRAEQQRSLGQMVRELARARYNTIFFQVRGRGDAMYRSQYEPWAESLTGTPGRDPGWDPLAFLLAEAHAEGMEVHAWFNAFLVRGGSDRRAPGAPVHVADRHPEWVQQANGEWWLDPGLPEARDYVVRVGMDIVRKYDIDGFQFDFIRYPAAPFRDDETFRRYGRGRSREEWRRDNVTRLVAAFHDSAAAVKPFLKLGAAPLGIYRNTDQTRGLQSFDDVYQDSRTWLAKGYLDYLAPQVYWSLGDRPGNPDFARVAREWASSGYGRQIILGIAAYKPEVAGQLGEIIDVARATGAAGHAFFRYSNVAGAEAVAARYDAAVVPPAMAWKGAGRPQPLAGFHTARTPGGVVTLSWQPPPGAGRVAIYRSDRGTVDRDDPGALLAVRPLGAGAFTDSSARPGQSYAMSVLDRAGNESPAAVELPAAPAAPVSIAARLSARSALGAAIPEEGGTVLFVPYEVGSSGVVAIAVLDGERRPVGAVVNEFLDAGRYVAAAEVGGFKKGWYTMVMTAGDYRAERRFRLE